MLWSRSKDIYPRRYSWTLIRYAEEFKMVKKARMFFFFLIVFLLVIQVVPINAKDNFAPISASWDRIGQESRTFMKTTVDVETKIIKPRSLSGIPLNDMHLIGPGTAIITIISSVKGYDVYVDGYLTDTEGRNEPLDGQITIRVDGDLTHTIRIVAGTYSNQITGNYEMGKSYTINL
jgi:hypothetical protein